jgi:hypothetical protein
MEEVTERPSYRWEDDIKISLKEEMYENVYGFICLRIFSSNEGSYKCRNEPSGS